MRFLDDWLDETVGHANTLAVTDKAGSQRGCRGLLVLGTDTDVGKSYVAELIIRHLVSRRLKVGAYKPVASGIDPSRPGDAQRMLAATDCPWPLTRVCPQAFSAALAPPVAATREGRSVDDRLLRTGALWWQDQCEVLVVEGAGGALSPLSPSSTVLDLAVDLGYPVVLVAAHRLGMINHVLLTLEAIAARQLPLLALVVNQVQLEARDNLPPAASVVELAESLACMLPFCGKIACYSLDYNGSTLSPAN